VRDGSAEADGHEGAELHGLNEEDGEAEDHGQRVEEVAVGAHL
jgi:hypothetical protein